jgi:hypothetical protein
VRPSVAVHCSGAAFMSVDAAHRNSPLIIGREGYLALFQRAFFGRKGN